MTKSRTLLFFIIILLAGLLSSCAGGATTATSWPGLSVDGDRAFVAFNTQVYAIDLTSGNEIWRFPNEPDNNTTFFADPVLTGDNQLIVGSYNTLLYSIDAETGNQSGQNWPFEGALGRYIAGALSSNGTIYAPNADTNLYALNSDGSMLWNFKTGEAIWATPTLVEDRLYLPSMDHHLYAINAEDGSEIWRTEDLGGSIVGEPAVDPGTLVYFGTFAYEVVAVDPQDGRVVWRTPTTGWVWSGPVLHEDILYVGDLQGSFYALNAADGSEVWSIHDQSGPQFAISGKPVVIGDTVYYTSEDGNIYAVDAATGNRRWNKEIGGQLQASPVVAGDLILVAPVGVDELVVALTPDGTIQWRFVPQDN